MPKENKVTKAEKETRIELVVDMLLKGKSNQVIIKFCMNKYKLTDRMVKNYLSVAREIITDSVNPDEREYKIGEASMRYNELYFEHWDRKDFRGAKRVQDSICKLLGLNEPERISTERELEPVDLSNYTDEELKAMVVLSRKSQA